MERALEVVAQLDDAPTLVDRQPHGFRELAVAFSPSIYPQLQKRQPLTAQEWSERGIGERHRLVGRKVNATAAAGILDRPRVPDREITSAHGEGPHRRETTECVEEMNRPPFEQRRHQDVMIIEGGPPRDDDVDGTKDEPRGVCRLDGAGSEVV